MDNVKEIQALIQKARKAQLKAQAHESEVFEKLSTLITVPLEDIESEAVNASNLSEAITRYISYGEYTIKGLMDEIHIAIGLSK